MAVRADDVDLIRDRSLVELCQAGDESAFGDLYSRYYQRLLRYCMRRVGNRHEAEEITQEAFARAFTAMPRFAGERRFYPWLTVIAARLCIDSHRRAARAEPSAEIDPGTVDGGQQQIIDNVNLTYLSQAMAQLGPRHREVLELRETQGWSYQQIADHYNVTMGTVEALLFRARKALRREFLALAGPEARLAGLPILGALWRFAANARARINDLSSNLAPAAAAGAMSIAAVAGGLGLVQGGGASSPPVVKPRPVATAATAVQALTGSISVDDKATQVADSGIEAAEETAEVITRAAIEDADSGRTRAAGDPASFDLSTIGVGTDATGFGNETRLGGITIPGDKP